MKTVFSLLNTPEIRQYVGTTGKPRIFDFGVADQGTVAPYIVFNLINNEPHDNLSNKPCGDADVYQVDIYTTTAQDLRALSALVRGVFDDLLIVNRIIGQEREDDTQLYRRSFEVDVFSNR